MVRIPKLPVSRIFHQKKNCHDKNTFWSKQTKLQIVEQISEPLSSTS